MCLVNFGMLSQVLALSNNSIGDSGIEALAAVLTSSTSAGTALANAADSVVGSPLESLALGGNPFGDAGATALASALVNATALRTLRCAHLVGKFLIMSARQSQDSMVYHSSAFHPKAKVG